MKTRNIKNKITKITKIIIISLLLFINIKNVDAESFSIYTNYENIWDLLTKDDINTQTKSYNTSKIENSTADLINNRQNDNKDEFIICAYSCSDNTAKIQENDKTRKELNIEGAQINNKEGTCGDVGTRFSTINYNTESGNKWKIEANTYLNPIIILTDGSNAFAVKDPFESLEITKYTWVSLGNLIPSGGIYYGSPTGSNKEESWLNTEAYNNLKTSFNCPQKMYYDTTLELSYDHITNEKYLIGNAKILKDIELFQLVTNIGSRKIQDNAKNAMELCYEDEDGKCISRNGKDRNFGVANNLSYSLTEELNTVFNGTNIELTNMEPSTILGRSFETKEDVCKALQNKMIDELINESTYENMLNEIFETKMRPDSPNKNMIDVQNIEKLILDKGYNNLDLKYNSESLKPKYEKLKEIYIKRLIDSKNYYANECNIDSSLIPDQQFETSATEKLNKIVQNYQRIDYSELDCDTLFADMADIIKYAYFVLEIIAVIIVIIRTALDYSKVFLSDEQDTLKKANSKLMKRIIVLVVILLLPALVNLFLRIFKIEGFNSENPLCVKIK